MADATSPQSLLSRWSRFVDWVSTTGVVILAVAALVGMNEYNRLIEESISSEGRIHSLSNVIGFGAGGQTGAWADWLDSSFSPAGLVAAHTALDLVFIACYLVLGSKALRAATAAWRRKNDDAPFAARVGHVFLLVMVGTDLIEDALLFTVNGLGGAILHNEWLTVVLAGATYLKWAATALVAYYLLCSPRVGSIVRRVIGKALAALYVQRLSTIVVLAVAAVSLVTQDGIFEQVADVYRGWIGLPADRAFWSILFAAIAFLSTGVGLFALGRRRAWHYSRMTTDDDGREPALICPWYVFAAVLGLVAALVGAVTRGAGIDGWPLFIFLAVVIGIVTISVALARFEGKLPAFRSFRLDDKAVDARKAGDLLVVAWIALWALGPFRALLSPLYLSAERKFDETDFANSFWWLLVLVLVFGIASITLPVLVRTLIHSITEEDEVGTKLPDNRLKATLAVVTGNEPEDKRTFAVVAAVIAGVSALVVVGFLLFPAQIAWFVGPIAVMVFLLGAWSTLLGMLMLLLGLRRPLVLFQVLRLRSTPVVALLVVLPLVAASFANSPRLHSIRFGEAPATAPDRPDLRTALGAWYTQQTATGCVEQLAGRSVTPMLLVAAEGGGIRASTWTVEVVKQLPIDSGCAATATFLSSGASGGSIGLASLRNAASVADPLEVNTDAFSGPDALAADMAGLLDGDLLGAMTGIRVPSPSDYADPFAGSWGWHDRTALQEMTWEHLAGQFAGRYDVTPTAPTGYLVLNSTDSVSNCKVVVSQLDLVAAPADPGAVGTEATCNGPRAELSNTIDLQEYIGDCVFGLSWSTAAELSARFPFVSPPGRISNETLPADCNRVADMQLVDGGLTDNSAIGTISDIAPELTRLITVLNDGATGRPDAPYVVPVLMFASNEPGFDVAAAAGKVRPDLFAPLAALDGAKLAQVTPSAWLTRVSDTLFDVCPADDANCRGALRAVREAVHEGVAVVAPSTSPAVSVPLGWSLSAFSRERLEREALIQAACGQAAAETEEERELALECGSANGDYGRYGDVLDLFSGDPAPVASP